jgi:YfiH family protein
MPISLKSPALVKAGFSHGFSTRAIDLHPGIPGYAENLVRFLLDAGIDGQRLAQVKQVHGTVTVPAEEALASGPTMMEGDAVVATGGLVAGIRVADCVPILGGDPESGVAVAIHSGWKGTVLGIVRSALQSFSERGGNVARSVFTIGPCICAACFEIGDDVAARIAEACGEDVIVRGGARPHADLRRAVRKLLQREGVPVIDDIPGCTRCDRELFFSYRRDGDPSGRHLAAIASR